MFWRILLQASAGTDGTEVGDFKGLRLAILSQGQNLKIIKKNFLEEPLKLSVIILILLILIIFVLLCFTRY